MSQSSNRDFSLDILRTLSCIMVLGVHLGQHITIPGAFGVFFSKGSAGVGFFFILSGYLACASLERLHDKYESSKVVIIVFWIKRLLRILPLYYLVILFYLVFFSVIGKVPEDNTGLYWVRYVFFINTFVKADNGFWTNLGAVWSIGCFVFFYLICPILYKVIRRYWSAWIVVILGYGLLKYIDAKNIYNLPVRWLFYFLMGILAFKAFKEQKEIHALCVLLFIILFCVLTEKGTAIIPPSLATIFILSTKSQGSNAGNEFCQKIIRYISTISYSIYLIHVAVIEVLDIIVVISPVKYSIVWIIFTLLLSVLSYYLIEKKLGDMLMKLAMKPVNKLLLRF